MLEERKKIEPPTILVLITRSPSPAFASMLRLARTLTKISELGCASESNIEIARYIQLPWEVLGTMELNGKYDEA